MANRLAEETSPYLLQHAHNPVDWYPWGPEALEKAREENKPILLSIGYAACHWCHVMERESFEDEETAGMMNEGFVSIKVDREERPDIDAIYMDAVQAMTGHGGWPMTMFLAPDGIPFYGGTYFPPDDRHGLPSFKKVLAGVRDAWDRQRDRIVTQGAQLIQDIEERTRPRLSKEPLTNSLLSHAVEHLGASFDVEHGGFGDAPKFPQAPVLEFLLRVAANDLGRSREMITLTLDRMALGGIYDQVGGGFSRYSVDDRWLVPHFEKMLYDNAQLARVYTRAWQLLKSPLYERIAIETLEYLIRDMRSPDGGFYASEDADSEGVEGKFYFWSADEVDTVAPESAEFFGVTPEGNFEGMTILTASSNEVPHEARRKLLEARSRRVRPPRDEKILASWNGLAISALAEAGAAFGRRELIDAAAAAASMVLDKHIERSRLLHSYKDGRAKVLGLLEDYAYFCEGLYTLWEVTLEPKWIEACENLVVQMNGLFWDEDEKGFFTTGGDHERLIVRQKEIAESATPAPNGVASLLLLKLGVLTGRDEYSAKGVDILRLAHAYMARIPQASGSFLCALDFYLSTPKEIVLIDDDGSLGRVVWDSFVPNKVLAGSPPGIGSPMLEGKEALGGRATAFVCERYVCKSPVTDAEALARQLV